MAELVEDFNLVGFVTLSVEDKHSMAAVLRLVDKANGYCFGDKPLTTTAYSMAVDGSDIVHGTDTQYDEKPSARWQATTSWESGASTLNVLERQSAVQAGPQGFSMPTHRTPIAEAIMKKARDMGQKPIEEHL